MRGILVAAALVAFASLPAPARAAVITDVQSSFDENDPFDIRLTVGYELHSWNTLITREDFDQHQLVYGNKLEFTRMWHELHIGTAIGLYQDFELVVDLPIIFSDVSKLGLHPQVVGSTACADPYKCIGDVDKTASTYAENQSANAMSLFDVPFTGSTRSGLGDLGIGLRFAPWTWARDHQYPTWVLGVMFRIPTAEVRKAGNTGVGEGLFGVDINTAISRRVASFIEPYFDLHGKLRFATSKSLFDNVNADTQTLEQPGHRMGLKLGLEFIPWEVEADEKHVSIDIGGGLDYTFEGREYSELFEALGNSSCLTTNGCWDATYTGQAKAEGQYGQKLSDQQAEQFVRTDGITDVEHYNSFSFWAGVDVQPVKYVEIGLKFNLAYTTPHFITFADAGKDLNGDGVVTEKAKVQGGGTDTINEYNPKYIEGLDEVGNRFRASRTIQWATMFNLSGRF